MTEAKLKNAAQDLKGAHFDEHVDLKVLKHFVGLFGWHGHKWPALIDNYTASTSSDFASAPPSQRQRLDTTTNTPLDLPSAESTGSFHSNDQSSLHIGIVDNLFIPYLLSLIQSCWEYFQ